MNINCKIAPNHLKGTAVFIVLFFIVLNRFISNTLLSQLNSIPIIFPEKELAYRLLLKTGLPQVILSEYFFAVFYDLMLVGLPVIFLFSRKAFLATIFAVFITIYHLIFNIITGHHYHALIGAIFITIPFTFNNEEPHEFLWEACRYYLLYIFTSAALWKISRGSAFSSEHLPAVLQAQQLQLQIEFPKSSRAFIARFLITHVKLAQLLMASTVLLQLSFVVGFFTKKYDSLLIIAFLFFVIGNYVVMSINTAEMLVLALTLVSWEALAKKIQELSLQYFVTKSG